MAADSDPPFDPVRVRLKIFELRKNLHGLETLMETYGLPIDPSRTRPIEHEPVQPAPRRRKASRRARSVPPTATPPKAKLADLAYDVIVKHGGSAHGKRIVADLQAAGHMAGVAHPDSNISTALSRDSRVERVPDVRNTWRVKK